jgi:hypothetical protein
MLNLIFGYLAVMAVTFALAARGHLGVTQQRMIRKIFNYDGPISFIAIPIVMAITFCLTVLPASFALMHALGILHIHMPTVFTESYSFYDSLHIDLALTLITAPMIISRRMTDASIRKDLGYE